MNQVHLANGLQCRQNPLEIQTELSISLRITAVVIGILAVVVGALILINVPELSYFGTTNGWTAVSLGAVLLLAGTLIKCVRDGAPVSEVKKQTQTVTFETPTKQSESSTITITANNGNSVSSTETKKTISHANQNLIDRLPNWLQNPAHVLPYQQLANKPVVFKDLEALPNAPTLFAAGQDAGIHMRLKAQYMTVNTSNRLYPLVSQNLHVIAWLPEGNEMYLQTDSHPDQATYYESHHSHDLATMLREYSFKGQIINLKAADKLSEDLRNEDLRSEYHLAWFLLRVLNHKPVEIPRGLGYWKISPDT